MEKVEFEVTISIIDWIKKSNYLQTPEETDVWEKDMQDSFKIATVASGALGFITSTGLIAAQRKYNLERPIHKAIGMGMITLTIGGTYFQLMRYYVDRRIRNTLSLPNSPLADHMWIKIKELDPHSSLLREYPRNPPENLTTEIHPTGPVASEELWRKLHSRNSFEERKRIIQESTKHKQL